MKMAIVYELMYGNTHAIADAIADGARSSGAEVTVQPVSEAPAELGADLLVVGGPTHMHGLTSELSRTMAASAAEEDQHALDPAATQVPRSVNGSAGWPLPRAAQQQHSTLVATPMRRSPGRRHEASPGARTATAMTSLIARAISSTTPMVPDRRRARSGADMGSVSDARLKPRW